MPYPSLSPLILPWTRREWPGTWRLLRTVVGRGQQDDRYWAESGVRTVRGKWHGYRMIVDLSNWADRMTYFLGRYYDAATQLALHRLLRPGDRFVDVGANNGMLTLLASRLVGQEGLVDAFEPHTGCCERIQRQIELNGIRNVRLHRAALSDAHGLAELHVAPDAPGYSTLAEVEGAERDYFAGRMEVQTFRGDDVLRIDMRPPRVIKIDVEGFELSVLRGLEQTLLVHHPAVLTEVNPYTLGRTGTKAEQVIALMRDWGYEGQVVREHEGDLQLSELPASIGEQTVDVLWVAKGEAMERSRSWRQAA